MQPATASRRITEEVRSWPGVEAGPGQRGKFAFKLGGREIGHLHGDHAAHFFFPKQLWDELRERAGSSRTRSSQIGAARQRGGSRPRPTSTT
jgi:hypothetical protein